MASQEDRLSAQSGVGGLADQGDSRRLHPVHSNSSYNDPRAQRPRGSSNSTLDAHNLDSTRYQQARQPITDAVKSAFNTTDAASNAAFPPELLQQITSQITANVLSQLKVSNISLPTQQSHLSGSQMDAVSSTAGSPPLDRSTVYTPPSPYRNSEDLGQSQQSPQFPSSSTQSSFRAASPPVERRPISPFSQASHVSEGEANQERTTRPKGPRRISTGGDATILERVWGALFNEQGQATPRLGQFLRGIAVHLIENYEPKHSLVITPSKLQRYYEETKLSNEYYPWKIIFDDRTSSISRMFREIEAQHHLVQEKPNERPDIPGLTPQGFETWVTLLLRAHPDQEFERLAKTALDMPISNPDEKKERFPKELSRRLFPKDPDTEVAYKLQKAMSTHCNVRFSSSRQGSMADTQSQSQSQSQTQSQPQTQPQIQPQSTATAQPTQPTQMSEEPIQNVGLRPPVDSQEPLANGIKSSPALSHASLERQRQPYSGVPNSDAVNSGSAFEEDGEDTPTPQPIERERKPYVAAPGLGKSYDNLDKPIPASGSAPETRPPPSQPEHKLGRSGSFHGTSRPTVTQSKPAPIAIHQRAPPPPMDIPETRHHRSNSIYHRDQPRRTRSPSASNENGTTAYMRRSESDVHYPPPPHYHASPSDTYEDTRRQREYEAQRERLANDRYDAARMAAYDPRERDRGRENRPRMQSVSGYDQQPRAPLNGPTNPSEEEYYRERGHLGGSGSYTTTTPISTGFHPPPIHSNSATGRDGIYGSHPSSARYPPSSYKDMQ